MSTLLLAIAIIALGHAGRRRLIGVRRDDAARPSVSAHASDHDDWAAFLDAIAADVRSGTSLRDSYVAACRRTRPRGRAIGAATELHLVPSLVSSDPDETVALQTLSVALSLGGHTPAVLRSGAALLRERASVRAEAAAHAAQARLSARVLTAVPLLFATWGAVASPSFRAALLGPLGAVAALLGLGLNAFGWWWMRHIVRGAAR